MFKKSIRIVGVVGSLMVALMSGEAAAVCGAGFRVTVVQNADIRLAPGAKTTTQIRLITLDVPMPAGMTPADCGVFARSDIPGISVISSYGIIPQATYPPGSWAPIGIASDAVAGSQPWFGTDGDRHILFAVVSDGTTPSGTQGQITLGVNQGGDITQVMRTIGTVNVVVGTSNATTWLSVSSTAQNVSNHRLILDHPLLNGNAGAKLFVAHVYNPSGLTPTFWNHPIATHFDGGLSRWTINNTDGAIMPPGLGFSVRIDPSATQYYTGNPTTRPPVSFVTINDPIANGNPYATIFVSPTTGLAVNAHPIAVQYVAPNWRIVNTDGTLIPAGVRFNVKAIGFSAYHPWALTVPSDRIDRFVSNSAGVSVSGQSGVVTDNRPLFFWWQLNKRSFPMLVTRTLSPMGQSSLPEPKYLGLKYLPGAKPQWSVIHEDGSPIPYTAAFNVVGPPQPVVQ
jgi:hypothetical protein